MTIRRATPSDLDEIRAMLREYAEWLQVDLCFQNFDRELAGLPGDYASPSGCLLIAEGAGCVALRRIDDERASSTAEKDLVLSIVLVKFPWRLE